MSSRFAIYTRSGASQAYVFSESFPTFKQAREKVQQNKRLYSNVDSIIIESGSPNQKVDPYHAMMISENA
jgi:hypothetical protein